jgi:hypothetical protein
MSTTITPVKTSNLSLLNWQDVANGDVIVGSAFDVSTIYALAVQIRMGRLSSGNFNEGWPVVRIEGSVTTGGNDHWAPIAMIQFNPGLLIANTTLNGAVSSGATSFNVNISTYIAVGDILFLGDTAPTNYELVRVKGISGTTITVEEPVTFSHADGAIVTNQAEMYYPAFDVSAYLRVRAVFNNAGSGRSVAIEVLASSMDSNLVTE